MSEDQCPLRKNILLTGPPRIGKTTVLKEVIAGLERDAGGFYTEEIRENKKRTGFRLVTLDGRQGILAHQDIVSPHRVGKYGVDLKVLEEVGVKALHHAIQSGKVIIIDEIGGMEIFSIPFREAVLKAIVSPQPVVATIQKKRNPFCDPLKGRGDVLMLEVTEENRDHLANQILSILSRYGMTPVSL